ncbi:MAG: bifunctional [glutamate--ammonia ligase]-adenylyl-L-tyrosine phosphorylase/[glutamate--ammonia-ligase] adenylyltransferase [Nitrospirae bacterium]|nr:bifunctional [glutamate--ammonia ligase]-adenylyl-L-tyrosine phosphorylase/[glutamate--ammonia-ligase] adenylyltransferase [Nitrospirota bacterium]
MSNYEKLIRDISAISPDPERAFKNISELFSAHPYLIDELTELNFLKPLSILFGSSQFLAYYCISEPEVLIQTLKNLKGPVEKESYLKELKNLTMNNTIDELMMNLRNFKKKEMLRITLLDLMGKADLVNTMLDLSNLASAALEATLDSAIGYMKQRYGDPEGGAEFSVIGMGKLGGEELNYSSDIDLLYLYSSERGETSGVLSSHGIRINRISNHEFYCKLGELLTKTLQTTTGEGFAYRVDLRLRPEGQSGDIAMSLRSYEIYYESWGRTWERAALLKARPVAGSERIGKEFLETVRPFVYRKYLDFSAVDEIRQMKLKIDNAFRKGDIKRGYGGIREIEFFTQALQLLYGGREPLLRERGTLKALHRMSQKGIISNGEYYTLSLSYNFLRKLEHRLQVLHDLQTHSLPEDKQELIALGRRMGYTDVEDFQRELNQHTYSVHSIYETLFSGYKVPEEGFLFDEELTETELKEVLKQYGFKDLNKAIKNIQLIKDEMVTHHTLKGRRLLSETLPSIFKSVAGSHQRDMALNLLQGLIAALAQRESYQTLLKENEVLRERLIKLISQSEYLSRLLIVRPELLETLTEEGSKKKTLRVLNSELNALYAFNPFRGVDLLRTFKHSEEIRLGLLFLDGKLSITDLMRGLTKVAEAILNLTLKMAFEDIAPEQRNMSIIGLGKLGGREITYGSDLDVVFVYDIDTSASQVDVAEQYSKTAERAMRLLMAYTKEGVCYRVDTRLRPEGSKGPLAQALSAFKLYYEKEAALWERQALLKARPVAGSEKLGREFICMIDNIAFKNIPETLSQDIKEMRERIERELSKEDGQYDIKFGPGGIEEIEFLVQYLQMKYGREHIGLRVPNTLRAISRLIRLNILDREEGSLIYRAYVFYRSLETYLRLAGRSLMPKEAEDLNAIAQFLGYKSGDALIKDFLKTRAAVRELWKRYLD